MDNLKAILNNNLLTVHHHTEIKLAMVDLWIMLTNSLKKKVLSMKVNIPTKL